MIVSKVETNWTTPKATKMGDTEISIRIGWRTWPKMIMLETSITNDWNDYLGEKKQGKQTGEALGLETEFKSRERFVFF